MNGAFRLSGDAIQIDFLIQNEARIRCRLKSCSIKDNVEFGNTIICVFFQSRILRVKLSFMSPVDICFKLSCHRILTSLRYQWLVYDLYRNYIRWQILWCQMLCHHFFLIVSAWFVFLKILRIWVFCWMCSCSMIMARKSTVIRFKF